jgi:serine/threonine protein kinase
LLLLLLPLPVPVFAEAPGTLSIRSRGLRSSVSSTNLSTSTAPPRSTQQQQQHLQLHEVIGSGTFGVVYRATWRGIPAAVKVVQLPGGLTAFDATAMQRTGSPAGPPATAAGVRFEGLGGARERLAAERRSSRREQMAVMETALGSSLSHPNIVQVGISIFVNLSIFVVWCSACLLGESVRICFVNAAVVMCCPSFVCCG